MMELLGIMVYFVAQIKNFHIKLSIKHLKNTFHLFYFFSYVNGLFLCCFPYLHLDNENLPEIR